MESSASGELGVVGPIVLMVLLAGFSLALIWLFGEPQRSRGSSVDEKGAAERSERTPAQSPAGRKLSRPGSLPRLPVQGVLERWGCFSRTVLRVVLQHLSMAVAVASFGILAGTAIAIIWRWIFGD